LNATRCPDRLFPGSVLNASDEDEKLVEKVAREIVEQHGDDSVEIVNERAEAAGLLAHELAAETWRDIATATSGCSAKAVAIWFSEPTPTLDAWE
jgi:hypothetical protein